MSLLAPRNDHPRSVRGLKCFPSHAGSVKRFLLISSPPSRLLIAVVVAVFSLILFGVGAVFGYFRWARGIDGVSFTSIVLPHRWHEVRSAVGEHLVGQGIDLLRKDRPSEAIHYLNAGLKKAPASAAGRIASAELRTLFGREEAAAQILIEGLSYLKGNERFVIDALPRILQLNAEAKLLPAVDALIAGSAEVPVPVSTLRRLEMSAAVAAFKLGQIDAAEDWLNRDRTNTDSLDGILLRSRLDWERGHRRLVLVQLRQVVDLQGSSSPALQSELILRLRQIGLIDEWRRRAIAFRLSHPDDGRARIELIHSYHASKESSALQREVESIFADFPRNQEVLLGLGEFAVAAGLNTLSERLVQHAEVVRLPPAPFRLLHVEALLAAAQPESAQAEIRRLRQSLPTSDQRSAVLDCLQASTFFALGDSAAARGMIRTIFSASRPRPSQLIALANRFVGLGGIDEACLILEHLVATQPANQAALTRLIELQLNSNRVETLPEHLLRLAGMRRPDTDVLRVARHKLGSDLFLFASERDVALQTIESLLDGDTVARR